MNNNNNNNNKERNSDNVASFFVPVPSSSSSLVSSRNQQQLQLQQEERSCSPPDLTVTAPNSFDIEGSFSFDSHDNNSPTAISPSQSAAVATKTTAGTTNFFSSTTSASTRYNNDNNFNKKENTTSNNAYYNYSSNHNHNNIFKASSSSTSTETIKNKYSYHDDKKNTTTNDDLLPHHYHQSNSNSTSITQRFNTTARQIKQGFMQKPSSHNINNNNKYKKKKPFTIMLFQHFGYVIAGVFVLSALIIGGVYYYKDMMTPSFLSPTTTSQQQGAEIEEAQTTTAKISPSSFVFRPEPNENQLEDISFFRNAYINNNKQQEHSVVTDDNHDLEDELVGYHSIIATDTTDTFNRFDDPLNYGPIFMIYTSSSSDDLTTPGTELYNYLSKYVLQLEQYIKQEFNNGNSNNKEQEEDSLIIEVISYYSLMLGTTTTNHGHTIVKDKLQHIAQTQFKSSSNTNGILIEIRYSFKNSSKPDETDTKQQHSHLLDIVRYYGNIPISNKDGGSKRSGLNVMYTGLPFLQDEINKKKEDQNNKEQRVLSGGSCSDVLMSSFLQESSVSSLDVQDALQSYNYFSQHFGYNSPLIGSWGRISPYRIIFHSKSETENIDTKDGFQLIQNVIQEFMSLDTILESYKQELEEEKEATIPQMNVVNLDAIPQRLENNDIDHHEQLSLDDLMNQIMDELYYSNGEDDIQLNNDVNVNGNNDIQQQDNTDQKLLQPIMRTMYDGISYIRNNPVPYPVYYGSNKCESNMHGHCFIEMFHILGHYYKKRFLSYDNKTTYIQAILGVNPFSKQGIEWFIHAKQLITKLKNNGIINTDLYDVSIDGGVSIEYNYYC